MQRQCVPTALIGYPPRRAAFLGFLHCRHDQLSYPGHLRIAVPNQPDSLKLKQTADYLAHCRVRARFTAWCAELLTTHVLLQQPAHLGKMGIGWGLQVGLCWGWGGERVESGEKAVRERVGMGRRWVGVGLGEVGVGAGRGGCTTIACMLLGRADVMRWYGVYSGMVREGWMERRRDVMESGRQPAHRSQDDFGQFTLRFRHRTHLEEVSVTTRACHQRRAWAGRVAGGASGGGA